MTICTSLQAGAYFHSWQCRFSWDLQGDREAESHRESLFRLTRNFSKAMMHRASECFMSHLLSPADTKETAGTRAFLGGCPFWPLPCSFLGLSFKNLRFFSFGLFIPCSTCLFLFSHLIICVFYVHVCVHACGWVDSPIHSCVWLEADIGIFSFISSSPLKKLKIHSLVISHMNTMYLSSPLKFF